MSVRTYDRKSRILILCLMSPIIIALISIGVLFPGFELLIPIVIPIVIFIAIVILLVKFSWNPQHYCSRCNYPVSTYAEFCRNCGLKLITRCPNCDIYVREGQSQCPNCGYALLEVAKNQTKSEGYEMIKQGQPFPSKPNFCPTCGASLKNAENFRFCEYCGSRIK